MEFAHWKKIKKISRKHLTNTDNYGRLQKSFQQHHFGEDDMTECEYCNETSLSAQVCTECGEPLVDNPRVYHGVEYDENWNPVFHSQRPSPAELADSPELRDDYDGQPDEMQEWEGFDPDF